MRKVRMITWINRHVSFPVLRFIAKLTLGKSVMCDYGIPLHIAHDMNDLFPTVTHLFEGAELSVPANSHRILQQLYGDYMQLPDLSSITGHVDIISLLYFIWDYNIICLIHELIDIRPRIATNDESVLFTVKFKICYLFVLRQQFFIEEKSF